MAVSNDPKVLERLARYRDILEGVATQLARESGFDKLTATTYPLADFVFRDTDGSFHEVKGGAEWSRPVVFYEIDTKLVDGLTDEVIFDDAARDLIAEKLRKGFEEAMGTASLLGMGATVLKLNPDGWGVHGCKGGACEVCHPPPHPLFVFDPSCWT